MPAEVLFRSDPRAGAFAALRRDTGLAGHFASCQSLRLGL